MVAAPDFGPIVITNVKIFDGSNPEIIDNATVVLKHFTTPDLPPSIFTDKIIKGFPVGFFIESVLTEQQDLGKFADARIIDGGGNILMPGLIDTHYHLAWADRAFIQEIIGTVINSDPSFEDTVQALLKAGVHESSAFLLNGFTAVREVGGIGNEIKQSTEYVGSKTAAANNYENLPTVRVWSSEAMISATAGHSDFADNLDALNTQDGNTHQDVLLEQLERVGFRVADGVDGMLLATRDQFKKGADLIKIAAGGGVSSASDPIDTITMTADEIKAVVEVAKGFGTYVTSHAYTSQVINLLIDTGVKMADHANLIDDSTMERISLLNHDADPTNDFWVNISPFFANAYANPKTGEAAIKKTQTEAGTAKAYAYAKKYDLLDFVGFGSDVVNSVGGGDKVPKMLADLATDINKAISYQKSIDPEFANEIAGVDTTYTNFDTLRMATSVNGEILGLSGLRSPYLNEKGAVLSGDQIGQVRAGAVADLVLVKYDSSSNLDPFDQLSKGLANVDENFLMILKDGIIYKNDLSPISIASAFDSSKVSNAEFISTSYQHILDWAPEAGVLSCGSRSS